MSQNIQRQTLEVSRVWNETSRILGIELRNPEGNKLPEFDAGAHLSIFMTDDLARQYSLCGNPEERYSYTLGVQKELESRGGSAWMHENIKAGMTIETSMPINNFPLGLDAKRYILIAGGVGVTPILSMAETLRAEEKEYCLYYCVRMPEDAAFKGRLESLGACSVVEIICDQGNPEKGLDVAGLLSDYAEGVELYCCGPLGLMNAVRDASAHWPENTVNFEWFAPLVDPDEVLPEGREEFTVVIDSTGQELKIGSDQTILEVLNDNNFNIEFVCREGICGTCIVDVLEGEIAHRDHILDDEDKASNELITTCCSRAISEKLVLDL